MNTVWRIAVAAIFLGIVLALGYAGYRFFTLQEAYTSLTGEQTTLQQELIKTQSERDQFAQKYTEQKNINDGFEGKLRGIAGAVTTLETLSKTDKELLQKYSKVYFLNENYIPSNLSEIPSEYVEGPAEQFHTQALPFLEDMITAAQNENISLMVISGYRSFGTQGSLKGAYIRKYGTGANSFSADQGYSEHQLGTTVDLTTQKLGTAFTSFKSDPAYEWLLNHAYQYGFILSYPEGNDSYIFEPWHWRFVGIDLATHLYREKTHFYELDQREIDSYLVKIFQRY